MFRPRGSYFCGFHRIGPTCIACWPSVFSRVPEARWFTWELVEVSSARLPASTCSLGPTNSSTIARYEKQTRITADDDGKGGKLKTAAPDRPIHLCRLSSKTFWNRRPTRQPGPLQRWSYWGRTFEAPPHALPILGVPRMNGKPVWRCPGSHRASAFSRHLESVYFDPLQGTAHALVVSLGGVQTHPWRPRRQRMARSTIPHPLLSSISTLCGFGRNAGGYGGCCDPLTYS